MRAVAKRLLAWADDLEAAVKAGKVGEAPAVPDAESVPASDTAPESADQAAEDVAVAPVAPATSAVPATSAAAPPLSELKAFLTDRCAAGYAAQVKALIDFMLQQINYAFMHDLNMWGKPRTNILI